MISDLLYVGNKAGYDLLKRDILRHWPNAVITDASDTIHEWRLSVELDIDQDEWLMASLVNGFFGCSLTWNLLRYSDSRKAVALMRVATKYLSEKDGE
jgi:hypothetical protein